MSVWDVCVWMCVMKEREWERRGENLLLVRFTPQISATAKTVKFNRGFPGEWQGPHELDINLLPPGRTRAGDCRGGRAAGTPTRLSEAAEILSDNLLKLYCPTIGKTETKTPKSKLTSRKKQHKLDANSNLWTILFKTWLRDALFTDTQKQIWLLASTENN